MYKVSLSPCVCHDVSERSSLHELHDDPELIPHQVAVIHLHHVLMVIVPHDHHLQLPHREEGSSHYFDRTEALPRHS